MKRLLLPVIILLLHFGTFAQEISFGYSVRLKQVSLPAFNGLHSFAFAQWNDKWLFIGGRTDGLHARQPFASFPVSENNTTLFVLDVESQQVWTASVNVLPIGLREQLQSTNMNFYQDDDTLCIAGGYGYSASANDHITYPNLTTISVSGLITAIMNGTGITPFFKQLNDQRFAVTGGHLGKIGTLYYLVGGHRFDGRYNPMGNATYVQTYVNGIRKFSIDNSGSQPVVGNYSEITDQVHLHRRDYNLVPQIFPGGETGYMISSGVFQVGVDLPFLYPVEINDSGYTPVTSFNQYLCHYHCANAALYDSVNGTMHALFFGGMSQYAYSNNVLVQDNNVPFVKTISRLSRDASGTLQEYVFSEEMPALIGASSEFIPNHALAHYSNDVIRLDDIAEDSVLIGHIAGGIHSSVANPFVSNNTSVTTAHNVIYEVWLVQDLTSSVSPLDGSNPFSALVYPNPLTTDCFIRSEIPYSGDVQVYVTDISGRIVAERYFSDVAAGEQLLGWNGINLESGIYRFTFVFEGKFSSVQQVAVK